MKENKGHNPHYPPARQDIGEIIADVSEEVSGPIMRIGVEYALRDGYFIQPVLAELNNEFPGLTKYIRNRYLEATDKRF